MAVIGFVNGDPVRRGGYGGDEDNAGGAGAVRAPGYERSETSNVDAFVRGKRVLEIDFPRVVHDDVDLAAHGCVGVGCEPEGWVAEVGG